MAEKGDLATLSQDNLYTVVAVLRLLWELERDTNTRALLEPLMDHRELLAGDQSKQQVWSCRRLIGKIVQSRTGGLGSIVSLSHSRPSLMIIALVSQFHVYLLWAQRLFSIVS